MSGIAGHLIRRAMDPKLDAASRELQDFKPPPGAMTILVITVIVFIFTMTLVDYFYGHVILTLAMVETPHEKMYLAVDPPQKSESAAPLLSEKTEDPMPPTAQAELLLVKRPLVISSLCTAASHLKAQVGRSAWVRGAVLSAIYRLLAGFCRDFLHGQVFPAQFIYSLPLSSIIANILVAPLMMTWTHLVISKPSSKQWMSRVPSYQSILKVVPATAVWALAQQLTIYVPAVLAEILGLGQLTRHSNADIIPPSTAPALAMKILATVFVAIAAYTLILIPATLTLTRVQASLLPEEDEALVPFDRTFDGKVVAESEGGSGKLGLLDAWRTFGWRSRRNLLKLIAQTLAFEMSLVLAYAILFAVQLMIILGPKCDTWMVVGKVYVYGNH